MCYEMKALLNSENLLFRHFGFQVEVLYECQVRKHKIAYGHEGNSKCTSPCIFKHRITLLLSKVCPWASISITSHSALASSHVKYMVDWCEAPHISCYNVTVAAYSPPHWTDAGNCTINSAWRGGEEQGQASQKQARCLSAVVERKACVQAMG